MIILIAPSTSPGVAPSRSDPDRTVNATPTANGLRTGARVRRVLGSRLSRVCMGDVRKRRNTDRY